MTKRISPERKTAYYVGMAIMILGGLLFFSVFVTAALNFGDFSNFEADARSNMFRAIGAMALLILGAVITIVGARGLSGSGVVLDPEKAREDLEPYSRMTGRMVKDALEEAEINLRGKPEKIVVIKCPACGKLCEEDSHYCGECGWKFQAD